MRRIVGYQSMVGYQSLVRHKSLFRHQRIVGYQSHRLPSGVAPAPLLRSQLGSDA